MTADDRPVGVTVVIPVRNGAPWLRDVIAAITTQSGGRPFEIVAVDDGSLDGSTALLESLARDGVLRRISGRGAGAAAAINDGIAAAAHPLICQIDQDVIVGERWLETLTRALDDPEVAAAQGYYESAADASLPARVMGLDLAWRYERIGSDTSHVCTGNTVYRRTAILAVGGFCESMGYGYDNDMSYRLRAAGHRLVICRDARSTHRWRDDLRGYWWQQYGFGYGRLDVVTRHPGRWDGDSVSPLSMMVHPVLTAVAWLAVGGAATLSVVDAPGPRLALGIGVLLLMALWLERATVGVAAWRRFGDPAALAFPVLHTLRNHAWLCAIVVWCARRLTGATGAPTHSMTPRSHPPAGRRVTAASRPAPSRFVALIPAHNEAESLPSVIAELRSLAPPMDLVVIDDGSTDNTTSLLEGLGVTSLRLPQRRGLGEAMRVGLQHAVDRGYDGAVRIDGDGQHRAHDIPRLLTPLHDGRADVVLGSRYLEEATTTGFTWVRLVGAVLGSWLSLLTGRRVTDPTSGFFAFGPRALRVLAEDHPAGYPEPELQLLVTRRRLSVVEVPVHPRTRFAGRSSLTPARLVSAGARVLLALVVEPLRLR